jgi:hypothetical protein
VDYDNLDLQDMGTEKQVLVGWREDKVRVTLLANETAEGRIKAVTERAITVEEDEGHSILCPWSAVIKVEEHSPRRAYGHSG